MNTEKENIIKNYLEDISSSGTDIQKAVAEEAASYESLEGFFNDLINHGCASGMISSLIYYYDTNAFYDKHYNEIEELREEFEDSTGLSIEINGDLKNYFAWFSFEQTAWIMWNQLEEKLE